MEILNSLIRENNISFLRISIVDILGEKRSIEFPASALKDIYNNLVKCDGSSLCGIGTADNSDRVICLDENSHYFISDNTLEIFGFLQEENEEILEKVLSKNKAKIVPIDFELKDLPLLPSKIPGTLCVLPNDLYEGFFIAKIQK